MKQLRRPLTIAALSALAFLGVQATPASAAEGDPVVSRGITIPTFYNPPTTLPSANGTLIRSEPLKLGLRLPGLNGPLPGTATRLMYKSTDSNGQPVAVTGAYIEPSARWTGSGPRPLVVLAPGTLGQGDQCAASLALENPLALNLTEGTVSVGYENLATYRLLAKGIAVAVTDYVGLGATDRLHTYVNRVDGGHAVLDAVRATRALAGTSVTASSPVGLYGYSQGGGATASAAELQPTYAPEITLAGAYSGAPPADLVKVLPGIDGSALAAAAGWTVNGLAQSVPALQPIIDTYINDVGRAALADVATRCVGDGIFAHGFTKTKSWTKQGISLGDVIAREPVVKAAVDAQRLGRLKPATPVRVATGVADDTVPHRQARQLAVDWCARGANVTYEPIFLPNLGDKIVLTNHFLPLIEDQGSAISWLTDRLAGKRVVSNCWRVPLML
ncbi:lipase family protein [Mumia zhuanghuii]|uniref:Triacylglycerol lipase n=1 Tax=Mumia zhuanghuii TaxID=2585211 RepID=A0A5C4ML01_9ACTN|nr:lipase family protein [Mumia zhuanghuii]TNC42454.1 triacylglycerol lipase [Mumia zhuanghuii]TNC43699.1 triacylglycerol lipase [Mumia zhuanghuii]